MTIHAISETIHPLGDSALVVHLGEGIDPAIHEKVQHLSLLLENNPFPGFIEAVPSYNRLTVYYHPAAVYSMTAAPMKKSPYQMVSSFVSELLKEMGTSRRAEQRLIDIPVAYGGEHGPDLGHVASHNGLSIEEVIHIHSSAEYLVYMIGFAPGFPFMGGMDERIATPRKDSPRLSITPGSVGIAGKQTGIYPLETPGGWQIIGRTPLDLFLPEDTPPTLLQSGDKVRFIPISPEEFASYKEGK
ncbi:MAG: 5-oxoprolinase subunit PxpB [Lysinibacillus sp.]